MPEAAKGVWRWLLLAGVVIALDQQTKQWMLDSFQRFELRPVTAWFNLVLVFNPGASFSFLAGAGGWQKWLFITLALAVSAWLLVMLHRHAAERLLPAALAMIVGGALGNVIDRLRFGAVVDFLDFHAGGYHWPAFNVADSAISVGVVLMILQQFLQAKEPK